MSHDVAMGQHDPASNVAPGAAVRHFELAPPCSLTPRSARVFLGVMSASTFAVAGFFSMQGFWPILPFAGLEIALLIWATRASMRAGSRRETITIDQEWITVGRHDEHGEQLSVFPRHWARVKLRAPRVALHPSRLLLESRDGACELGRFLTEAERCSLAVRLKQLVGNVNESPALR